mmetsp:Transcript_4004/g.12429  ORF Transcript_4004/g.12429 Transcript_4004/m.12429 type:complete len:173 (-) Transcript_4004:283-801(-)|eukprot:CAMPEP_0198652376 /NCGR_PEP_ID=MMETSP1467-20131203/6332_1 /TAXON_ID=1462469 /ORGANISM="unid. sp., Strain CCMP2135" /LENGTH=172 /DNA_ID=CAMNT_0044388291 /DNA_START=79 /DNA_END=597 /DNA_ORIENTATION=+
MGFFGIVALCFRLVERGHADEVAKADKCWNALREVEELIRTIQTGDPWKIMEDASARAADGRWGEAPSPVFGDFARFLTRKLNSFERRARERAADDDSAQPQNGVHNPLTLNVDDPEVSENYEAHAANSTDSHQDMLSGLRAVLNERKAAREQQLELERFIGVINGYSRAQL